MNKGVSASTMFIFVVTLGTWYTIGYLNGYLASQDQYAKGYQQGMEDTQIIAKNANDENTE
jgi:hypothetical protein